MGIPVMAGTPAMSISADRRSLFQLAMHYVELDDYHGLMELARCGLDHSFDEQRRCGFTCNLKPGASATFAGLPIPSESHWLDIRGANLLHYATCIGAFRAASALIVICPQLLSSQCAVVLCSGSGAAACKAVKWGAGELARFFCNLYSAEDTAPGSPDAAVVTETGELYRQALPVLALGERNHTSLPYLALPTVFHRVKAAGHYPAPVLAAFINAAAAEEEEREVEVEALAMDCE